MNPKISDQKIRKIKEGYVNGDRPSYVANTTQVPIECVQQYYTDFRKDFGEPTALNAQGLISKGLVNLNDQELKNLLHDIG